MLGQAFAPAAPFLALLIFAGFARLLVSVSLSILIAAERLRWVLLLTGPVVPVAIAAYVVVIPHWGPRGAALTTTALTVFLTISSLGAVYLAWGVKPSTSSIARAAFFSVMVYAAALAWPATGIMLLIKLIVIGGLVPVAYFASGEFEPGEIGLLRSVMRPEIPGSGESPTPDFVSTPKSPGKGWRFLAGTKY